MVDAAGVFIALLVTTVTVVVVVALIVRGVSSDPQGNDCRFTYEWGPCSASCGVGTQKRQMIITHPATDGGEPCPPVLREATRPCMVKECGNPCPDVGTDGVVVVQCGTACDSATGHVACTALRGDGSVSATCTRPCDMM